MKVLVAYDGSPCSEAAIESLKRAGLPREGEALVVCVADEVWPPRKDAATEPSALATSWVTALHEAERLARDAADRMQSFLPAWNIHVESLWGAPGKAILQTVGWWKPDLLVVGSHGRTRIGRLVLGSVSLDLIHHAGCPVRVVRDVMVDATKPLRVLVAIDGSPRSDNVLHEMARRSWPKGTTARVVAIVATVVPPPTTIPALESSTYVSEPAFRVILEADERERARLRDAVENAARKLESAGLEVEPTVIEGDPRTAILQEARRWNAEVIFVGARGLGTWDRLLLGSVSTAIVTHADCTVEVIHSPS